MKKTLLLLSFIFFFAAGKAQLLYNMADSANFIFRASGWGQTNNALNSQVIMFDDIHIPKANFIGYDSIEFTKMTMRLVRYANAPAATLNLWYSRIVDTFTLYSNAVKLPPVLLGSFSLPAQGATSQAITYTFGDSLTTLYKVKVDTGVYYYNHASFVFGVSYSDTTGNGFYLGASTGNTTPNDNVFFVYNPVSSTTQVTGTRFSATYPRAQMQLRLWGRPANALPVTFTQFKGERKDNKNVLLWSTSTEQNNAGFEIERSADGKSFSGIAKVGSKAEGGNSNATLNYSFVDETAPSGNNYYRLKQVDKDGKFAYSSTVMIKGDKATKFELVSVYPNPVVRELNVKFNAANAEKVQIVITDLTGKTIRSESRQLNAGENLYNVNVATLQAGTYIIRTVTADGTTITQKFIKQ